MLRIPALFCVMSLAARAAVLCVAGAATASDDESAGLRLRTLGSQRWHPAPALHMDVSLRVTGPVARARVIQRFRNPGEGWVEGVYVFPLPGGSAVDALRLRVGDRVFEGRVEERRDARRRYTDARRRGSAASLVEQERPNLFTTSIANIGPGQEVEVEIEYQELLRFADGRFELHFPLALTPRYIPNRDDPRLGSPRSAAVPDAHRISPERAAGAGSNWVDLFVELDTPGARCRHRDRAADRGGSARRRALREARAGRPHGRTASLERPRGDVAPTAPGHLRWGASGHYGAATADGRAAAHGGPSATQDRGADGCASNRPECRSAARADRRGGSEAVWRTRLSLAHAAPASAPSLALGRHLAHRAAACVATGDRRVPTARPWPSGPVATRRVASCRGTGTWCSSGTGTPTSASSKPWA